MNNTTCDYCEATGTVFSVNRDRWEPCPYECDDITEAEFRIDRAADILADREVDGVERIEVRL